MVVSSDATFGDMEDGGSTDFSVIYFCGKDYDEKYIMVIDWRRGLQSNIANSSMEAEIVGQSKGDSRGLVIIYLADGMGWNFIPYRGACDNTSGIRVLEEAQMFSRSAHIKRHFYHTRHMVMDGVKKTHYVKTSEHLSDTQTKFGIATKIHQLHNKKLLALSG